MGGFDAAGECNGAGEGFKDDGVEAKLLAVDGGEADAEVVGEATKKEAREAAFAQIAGETGGRGVIVFEEGGIGVDLSPEAFAQDELGVGDIECGVECGAGRVLEAVIGPEGLGTVGGFDPLIGLGTGVRGGEGDVAGRVPVLGE